MTDRRHEMTRTKLRASDMRLLPRVRQRFFAFQTQWSVFGIPDYGGTVLLVAGWETARACLLCLDGAHDSV